MSGNMDKRVDGSLAQLTGPLVGENLLCAFKEELIKQPVFQTMFGVSGERIFDRSRPSLNETILPALLLSWKSETFTSLDTYFEGMIDAIIALPVRLSGDFNALRRVGSMLQRFMGGPMDIFPKVPGLINFGVGSEFNYEGLAAFDGLTCPVIQITIPFKFDLLRFQILTQGTDFSAGLDQSDLKFVEDYLFGVIKDEDKSVLIPEGVLLETGETN